jgi:hypothetical protein
MKTQIRPFGPFYFELSPKNPSLPIAIKFPRFGGGLKTSPKDGDGVGLLSPQPHRFCFLVFFRLPPLLHLHHHYDNGEGNFLPLAPN